MQSFASCMSILLSIFEKYVVHGTHIEVNFAQYSNEKFDDELLKA